jgi:hypothetical protein
MFFGRAVPITPNASDAGGVHREGLRAGAAQAGRAPGRLRRESENDAELTHAD